MAEFSVKKLPVREPLIKLTPIMKLNGKVTVSIILKSTLLLSELFCIPIIKSENNDKLNNKA